jgi:hypothetical protein
VITGDVVGSSKLSPHQRKKLLVTLKRAARSVQKAFGKNVPFGIDIFRGDSWQLFVFDPSKSIRVGLFMRAAFKAQWGKGKNDTRIAIGVGTVDFIPSDRISEGDGEAFRLSGTALETMRKNTRMRIALPDKDRENTMNVVLQLIDTLASRWTDRQAYAVMGALQGLKQDEIAQRWENATTQQNIAKHLSGSGWNSIGNALSYLENNFYKL